MAVKDTSEEYSKKEESRYIKHEEEFGHLSFGSLDIPRFPAFLASEHFERRKTDVDHISYQDEWEGVLAEEETISEDKAYRYGIVNHYGDGKDRVSLSVQFKPESLEGFTDDSRQNYVENIYEERVETQLNRIMDASSSAIDFVIGDETAPDLEDIRDNYQDRYGSEIGVMEAVEREFRLLGGEKFDPEAENYIEAVTENYLSGDISRPSPVLLHYNRKAEDSPVREGNMSITEIEHDRTVKADGSGKHRENLSHYLDTVWQIAAEKDKAL